MLRIGLSLAPASLTALLNIPLRLCRHIAKGIYYRRRTLLGWAGGESK